MARKDHRPPPAPEWATASESRRAAQDQHNLMSAAAEFFHAATHLVRKAAEGVELLIDEYEKEEE